MLSHLPIGEANNNPQPFCQLFFLQPFDVNWLPIHENQQEIQGRLQCPYCTSKLGSFDWSGKSCSCGEWVTPAFCLQKDKVDVVVPFHKTIIQK